MYHSASYSVSRQIWKIISGPSKIEISLSHCSHDTSHLLRTRENALRTYLQRYEDPKHAVQGKTILTATTSVLDRVFGGGCCFFSHVAQSYLCSRPAPLCTVKAKPHVALQRAILLRFATFCQRKTGLTANSLWRGRGWDRDPKSGRSRRLYLTLHCHHQNDSCIKLANDESHFNVSLIVRDKVTGQCPRTTAFEEKRAGVESNRRLSAYQHNALSLGQNRLSQRLRYIGRKHVGSTTQTLEHVVNLRVGNRPQMIRASSVL